MEKFQLPPEYDTEELRKLVELFPQFWKESYFDFEEMKSYVSGIVPDDLQEKYSFTWHGKTESYRLLKKNSNGTLRPCKEESVNWDTTQNLYIEGDNLEVLKLIKHTYAGERGVKMIYIDPPYNTGKDFIYDDNFMDSLDKYLEYTNQKGIAMPEASGRYHTRWLNMMYPRLWLANYLLRDDGVLVINMDENEIANLLKLMDEVFGEENNLGLIVWDKRNPKGDAKGIATQHEYIVFYAKNKKFLTDNIDISRPKKNAKKILQKAHELFTKIDGNYLLEDANKEFSIWINNQNNFSGGEKAYNKIDKNGNVYRLVSMAWPNKKQAPDDYFIPLIHPVTKKPCPLPARGWRNSSSTMQELLEKDLILFGKDETTQPNRKYLLKENLNEKLPSLVYYGGSDTDLLFRMEIPFETPKAIDICKEHIQVFTKPLENDIILDFFSGSATTAHAVMQLNAEDGGNRRFICVQLPEACDEKSEAYKAGYRNICEIGKERIRRAGKKILEEWQEKQSQIKIEEQAEQSPPDIGFRVFKLDKSNFRTWDDTPIERNEADKLIQQMELYADSPFIEGRSHEDIVYEVIRMNNYPLTTPILPIKINAENPDDKKIVYGVGEDCDFIICLDVPIGEKEATELCKYRPGRILFTDSCFENTEIRVNVEHTIRNINAKIKLKVV